MEKPWFPQRNFTDSSIALIKTLVTLLELKVSQPTIENRVKKHKEYPYLTFEAMREILGTWGVNSVLHTVDLKSVGELPSLSILFINEMEGGVKMGHFVLFWALTNDIIEYLHPRKGWIKEDLSIFISKWPKLALSLVSIESQNVELDFDDKEAEYNKQKFENPELKNISVRDNFLSDDECDYLINLSNPLFKKSLLMEEKNIEGYGRTSFSAEFHVFPEDKILNGIRERAAKIINEPESHFEFFQCVSYETQQEYQNHYDTFDPNSERGKKEIEERGQRKYTLLAYLNDDFEGGGTYFPNVDILLHPKKGRVVIFKNIDDNGDIIKAAYHAGLPVSKGRKYATNIWVRNKPFRNLL